MFLKINLEGKSFSDYSIEANCLDKLAKVNLFVGPNNTGKSRLMRNIIAEPLLEFVPADFPIDRINRELISAQVNIGEYLRDSQLDNSGYLWEIASTMNYREYISSNFQYRNEVIEPLENLKQLAAAGYDKVSLLQQNTDDLKAYIYQTASKALNLANEIPFKDFNYNFENIYIPVLRGLRSVSVEKELFYQRTIKDYFEGKNINIFTGESLYTDLKKLLLGDHAQRQRVKAFELFLSKYFFNNQEITLIPRIEDDVVYIKIGEDADRPIYNIGDGIQMIIIMTYPIFFRDPKQNLKVFIEEPELYLHPGMQRILLDVLTDKTQFPKCQFFLTTHSNHFLDMTADFNNISVYKFEKSQSKIGKFNITNVQGVDEDILLQLGVLNSSVFLSNCTIWVEGITDRIYIRKYLEVYFEKKSAPFKEDIHYSFVEYGGNNITHWSFLEDDDANVTNINIDRLCGRVFLIADSDSSKERSKTSKKSERHEKLSAKLKKRFYLLQGVEIENTLSAKVIEETVNELCAPDPAFEIGEAEYSDKSLGDFIDSKLGGKTSKKFGAQSGTIKDKVKFAKTAVMHIKSTEDMSEEAMELCDRIYKFIGEMNPS